MWKINEVFKGCVIPVRLWRKKVVDRTDTAQASSGCFSRGKVEERQAGRGKTDLKDKGTTTLLGYELREE